MPSVADQTFWLLTTLLEAFVVCLFFVQRQSSRFLLFSAYFLFSVTIGIARYVILASWGIGSRAYASFYYYTDALLWVLLFLSIFDISSRFNGISMPRNRVLLCGPGISLATAWWSYEIVSASTFKVMPRFAFELSQNLFIACCVAVLSFWILKLRYDPQDGIAARFVNVLIVYFLLIWLDRGVRQLAPHEVNLSSSLWPIAGAWLPLGCGFALVSQERPPRMNR